MRDGDVMSNSAWIPQLYTASSPRARLHSLAAVVGPTSREGTPPERPRLLAGFFYFLLSRGTFIRGDSWITVLPMPCAAASAFLVSRSFCSAPCLSVLSPQCRRLLLQRRPPCAKSWTNSAAPSASRRFRPGSSPWRPA